MREVGWIGGHLMPYPNFVGFVQDNKPTQSRCILSEKTWPFKNCRPWKPTSFRAANRVEPRHLKRLLETYKGHLAASVMFALQTNSDGEKTLEPHWTRARWTLGGFCKPAGPDIARACAT